MRRSRPVLLVLILAAAALACNLPGLQAAQPTGAAATGPAEASRTSPPPATGEPPTLAVVTPEVTPTAPIVHTMFPGEPPAPARFMTDRSTAPLAADRRSIADNFNIGAFERPFTSQAMEYKGYLDLTRAEIAGSGPWMYVTLSLEWPPVAAAPASYAVEIDTDMDGRGDWIVIGGAPPGTDWTTDGVRVYQDTNNDVGANTPVQSDPPSSTDGYETLVFDQGSGPDPDAAWIRISPAAPNRIQLAFKAALIAGDAEFLWWGWAFADPQPAQQDYQDHFTLAQAGSPLSESPHYPIKDLALIDSTCRWGYDFNPSPGLPGVCPPPPTPTPTPTKTKTPTATPIIIF